MFVAIEDVSSLKAMLVYGTVGSFKYAAPIEAIKTAGDLVQKLEAAPFKLRIVAQRSKPTRGIVVEVLGSAKDRNGWLKAEADALTPVDDVEKLISTDNWKIERGLLNRLQEPNPSPSLLALLADDPSIIRPSAFFSVDQRTKRVLSQGFAHKGHTFSLSQNAQNTYNALYQARSNLEYPVVVNTIDDQASLTISSEEALSELYHAYVGRLQRVLAEGTALKERIRNAKTEDAVRDIVNRMGK